MPEVVCNKCQKQFYVKPSHIKLGWGKYCSIVCRAKSQFNGSFIKCYTCSKDVYRSDTKLKRSASGKYFCSKTCQTLWRNSEFIGEKHGGWKSGESAYRDVLKRSGRSIICMVCGVIDERVLIGHHKDHNRKNNKIDNLIWLCLNCHFLVHHDKKVEEMLK